MTLEEAQAEILALNEKLTVANTEKENLLKQNEDLQKDNTKIREINQQYFLKLSAQYKPQVDKDEDKETVPTCEDFAKSLNI